MGELDSVLAEWPGAPIRHDCAFCHRERSAKDNNHTPECPY